MRAFIPFLLVPALLGAQAPPPALVQACQAFAEAAQRNDAEKLAALAHFPIRSNEFGTIASAAQLRKALPRILPKARREGLAGQKPEHLKGGVYALGSRDPGDPIQFLFRKFGQEYRLFDIDNVNE